MTPPRDRIYRACPFLTSSCCYETRNTVHECATRESQDPTALRGAQAWMHAHARARARQCCRGQGRTKPARHARRLAHRVMHRMVGGACEKAKQPPMGGTSDH
jgi:hypothetical protein